MKKSQHSVGSSANLLHIFTLSNLYNFLTIIDIFRWTKYTDNFAIKFYIESFSKIVFLFIKSEDKIETEKFML